MSPLILSTENELFGCSGTNIHGTDSDICTPREDNELANGRGMKEFHEGD
jgi:hypothetical protein